MTSRRFLVLSLPLGVVVCAIVLMVGGFAHHVANGVSSEAAGDPVIGAAGDIACDPGNAHFNGGLGDGGSACRQKYTSDLLVNQGLAGVVALGDNQYYCGGYQAFLQSYDLSWGRVKSITHPAVGNHEFLTSGGTDCTSANQGAAGYFRYFDAAAGVQGQGYYSYDIGTWHLIALNTNCSEAGGCGATSPQGLWLQADLATHTNYCTLAYWHIPLFSSGGRANANSRPFWDQLYAANADVILSAHDHLYERFAPQTPTGNADPVRGIREFIVGTGGANATSLATIVANSEVRNDNTAGVLKLILHATSYDWQFVPEAGKTFTDSGTTQCHGTTTTATTTAAPTMTKTSTPTTNPIASTTATQTPTPTPIPTSTSMPGSTLAVTAVADAYVSDAASTTNYGALTTLRVDGSPIVRSYLRFNVQEITDGVSRAELRVFANSNQSVGYEVHGVVDTSWGETAITFANAPPFAAVSTGSSGPVSTGTWTTVDVTPLVTGNGLVSLALTTPNTTALSLGSRESGANAPQLIIVAAATLTATATPIATDTLTATATPSRTATPTPTMTPTATSTPTGTPTATMGAPLTSTSTPTATATPSPTVTSVPTSTQTPTSTPTPTSTSIPASTLAVTAVADAYVSDAAPTTNYGGLTTLRVDGSPIVRSFLRFNVQGITNAVSRAQLRVFANSNQSVGYEAHGVADTSWGETAITFANAPPFAAASTGSSGPVVAGTWTTVDVTPLVTGNGLVSLALTTSNTTSLSLGSRESGANAPQLIIDTAGAPPGG